MPTDLSLLACGQSVAPATANASELERILGHIQTSMDEILSELAALVGQEARRVSLLGPFLGRSLLELAATALIGRLDPLRLLVVREVQAQPTYETTIVWKAAIRWNGDVVGKKAPAEMWGDGVEYEKVTRALLGDYYDHLFWRPAADRMLVLAMPRGTWLAALATIDAKAFATRKRDEILRLYTSLSKGLHHEFVLPPGALYDRTTVVDLVQRTIHIIADIGLVSHFIPHAACCLTPDKATDLFNRVESMDVFK